MAYELLIQLLTHLAQPRHCWYFTLHYSNHYSSYGHIIILLKYYLPLFMCLTTSSNDDNCYFSCLNSAAWRNYSHLQKSRSNASQILLNSSMRETRNFMAYSWAHAKYGWLHLAYHFSDFCHLSSILILYRHLSFVDHLDFQNGDFTVLNGFSSIDHQFWSLLSYWRLSGHAAYNWDLFGANFDWWAIDFSDV